MTSVSVTVSLYPLSRSAGEGSVRALIPTFSREREKGKSS